MFSKSIRIALFFGIALCSSLGLSRKSAHAQDPMVSPGARTDSSPLALVIIYHQPPSGALIVYPSSQIGYNQYGSDYDNYIWENFTLNTTRTITKIDWRGGYSTGGYYGGGLTDFIISIYPSTASDTQPDHLNPPLVQYTVGGNASETPPWVSGGWTMTLHDYTFLLPAPFTATAGTKYWLQIEGIQNGPADWGVAVGTGSDNSHFYGIPGVGDFIYGIAGGDIAFTLLGPSLGTHMVYMPHVIK